MISNDKLVKIALKNAHKLPDSLKEELQKFIIRAAEEAETKGK